MRVNCLWGLIRTHNTVVFCTTSGWPRKTLKQAGINTDLSKAHSTRSVSSSKASMGGAPLAEILKGIHGLVNLYGTGFIIRILFRKIMYFRIWSVKIQVKINDLNSELENWATLSWASWFWENSVLDHRDFIKRKFAYYIRAQSTHNIIPILGIKSEYNLILASHLHHCVIFCTLLILICIYGDCITLCRISKMGYLLPN